MRNIRNMSSNAGISTGWRVTLEGCKRNKRSARPTLARSAACAVHGGSTRALAGQARECCHGYVQQWRNIIRSPSSR